MKAPETRGVAWSLRLRLTAIILLPLMTVALMVGWWQLDNARRTAAEVFDRSLLSAALAVANDVAISEGDALSLRTRDILAGTSGGQVFYHVYAPDGVIVAGYATPPVGIPRVEAAPSRPNYFDAIYMGRNVSGVRVQSRTEIDGFAGIFTTTVWQDSAVRARFVQDLMLRSLGAIAALLLSLALIVWFGVRMGLRPLSNLENAIALRSSADLSPIRRAVPPEVGGVVRILNQLFGQVSRTMEAQSAFIANAAHQLRNPIAGVLALAEAADRAPTEQAARERVRDLLDAARETATLSHKLLMLERADALTPAGAFEPLDLCAHLPEWAAAGGAALPDGVRLETECGDGPVMVAGDATMLREAVVTLVDNAARHGGAGLRVVRVGAVRAGGGVALSVRDDGRGIAAEHRERALERFATGPDSASTGLGLSIAGAIAAGHGGTLALSDAAPHGLTVTLHLPAVRAS